MRSGTVANERAIYKVVAVPELKQIYKIISYQSHLNVYIFLK
jgi:hypothetical protein